MLYLCQGKCKDPYMSVCIFECFACIYTQKKNMGRINKFIDQINIISYGMIEGVKNRVRGPVMKISFYSIFLCIM